MDKRVARREAHGLIADMIWAHLQVDERFLDDEPSADEDRINAALEALMEEHRRRSWGPA